MNSLKDRSTEDKTYFQNLLIEYHFLENFFCVRLCKDCLDYNLSKSVKFIIFILIFSLSLNVLVMFNFHSVPLHFLILIFNPYFYYSFKFNISINFYAIVICNSSQEFRHHFVSLLVPHR